MDNCKNKTGLNLHLKITCNSERKAIITKNADISYSELKTLSHCAANLLKEKGLKGGDTLLIFMPNSAEYAILFFAATQLCLNIALANSQYKDSELSHLIKSTHPKMALTFSLRDREIIHASAPDLIVFLAADFIASANTCPCLTDSLGASPASMSPCIYIATSGSTGKPKIICNLYQNEFVNAALYANQMNIMSNDIVLTALPVTQRFGLAALLGCLMKGATLILPASFHACTVLSLIEEYHVTVQYGVPTMYLKEMSEYQSSSHVFDISSLRTGIVAGSYSSPELFRWFEKNAGCILLNCYGTSEVGGVSMTKLTDPPDIRHETCGHPFDQVNIEIINGNGYGVSQGEKGMITCTTPWVMLNYIGESTTSHSAFNKKSFFETGDIGYLNKSGHLIICGRKTDLIIRGGYNVFPAEIEKALLHISFVQEACVIGYTDALLGEKIVCFVKVTSESLSGKPEIVSAIRAELTKHIAKYKLPDSVIILRKLPRLSNGKYDCLSLKSLINTVSQQKQY